MIKPAKTASQTAKTTNKPKAVISNVEWATKLAYFNAIGYTPHAGQELFHKSAARFRLANCGRRFGKSKMSGTDAETRLLKPNNHQWIVGPTYDLGEKEFKVIWQDMIVKLGFGRSPFVDKAYNKRQGNMFIHFKQWDSSIYVKSAKDPDSLVGEGLDHLILSEAAKHPEGVWSKYLRSTLADKRGSADFPTTPESFNWYYEEWLHGMDAAFPEYESWKFPTWDNKIVFPLGIDDPEIVLLKNTMGTDAFTQEIEADFSSFAGKIYPEWDVSKNVKSLEFNPNWPNYISFDFGYTNPLAGIEWQVSPDDKIYIWREHYKSNQMLSTHIEQLKKREQPPGYHITMCTGDAADPEAVAVLNDTFAPTVADPRSKTNWRDGIELVRSFLEREVDQDEYGGPIDGPALFVDIKCINTIKEFNNYRAPDDFKGRNISETALKQDDHAMDALRYGLVHVYRLGVGDGNTIGVSNEISSSITLHTNTAVETKHPLVTPSSLGLANSLNTIYVSMNSSTDRGFFTRDKEF